MIIRSWLSQLLDWALHPWGMAEENGPIWVCRGLRTPLGELWPRLKKWN